MILPVFCHSDEGGITLFAHIMRFLLHHSPKTPNHPPKTSTVYQKASTVHQKQRPFTKKHRPFTKKHRPFAKSIDRLPKTLDHPPKASTVHQKPSTVCIFRLFCHSDEGDPRAKLELAKQISLFAHIMRFLLRRK